MSLLLRKFAARGPSLAQRCLRQFPRAYQGSVLNLADTFLTGANATYVEETFQRWKANPASVHSSWDTYFRTGAFVAPPSIAGKLTPATNIVPMEIGNSGAGGNFDFATLRVLDLVRHFQNNGHLIAEIDPLGLEKFRLGGTAQNPELTLAYHGFGEQDMEKKFNIGIYPNAKGFLSPGVGELTLREIHKKLLEAYCGPIGYEINHITSVKERNWLRERIETVKPTFTPVEQERFLWRLNWAVQFEAFLKQKNPNLKRFGLEEGESAILALRELIRVSSDNGVSEFLIGMPHRGRLNVMVNVVHKPLDVMLAEYSGMSDAGPPIKRTDGRFDLEAAANPTVGDVKYHQGYSSTHDIGNGKKVHVSLIPNPSHLEAVNALVLGKTKAKQDAVGDEGDKIVSVLLHGDASFAGQGIVYESFALHGVPDYRVGGTIHLVINNQVGFTTDPANSRSGPYCSDLGKAFQAPIFHVNGDDPEAVVRVCRLAAEFRAKFKRDVVVDVVCYRVMGHNEQDQPKFTQPLMYKAIEAKVKAGNTVTEMYQKRLLAEGKVSKESVEGMVPKITATMEEAFTKSRQLLKDSADAAATPAAATKGPNAGQFCGGQWNVLSPMSQEAATEPTGVPLDVLKAVGKQVATVPDDYKLGKSIRDSYEKRKTAIESGAGVDWPLAESLAFATLMAEGVHVRLAGQDAERGTFSHRHAVVHDQENGREYFPLKSVTLPTGLKSTPAHYQLGKKIGRVAVINSTLSEFAALGFELGYSMESPMQLVLWEAQFGDFVNGAQIIIDNFMASGEHKWNKQNGLVLLLPHGYEGQGAEHSSARMERFLQLCNDDPADLPRKAMTASRLQRSTLQLVNVTSAANYYHVLRRQVKRGFRKPLIVMTPKSLLRNPLVHSPLSDFVDGSFQLIIEDPHFATAKAEARKAVKRHLLCSGKVYNDLVTALGKNPILREKVAVTRVEQIAPFPYHAVDAADAKFPNADLAWVQEEHMNMGAWTYVKDRIETSVKARRGVNYRTPYFGRSPSGAAATGSSKVSDMELALFLEESLAV